MVSLQKAKLPREEVLGWNHVGVKGQIFVVCVFITSIPLMADGFDRKVGVVDLVYEVEDSEGGHSNEN